MKKQLIIFLGSNFHNRILRIEQSLPNYLSCYYTVYCFEYPRFNTLTGLLLRKFPLLEKLSSTLYIYHSLGLLPFGRTISFINKINHLLNYLLFTLLTRSRLEDYTTISFTPEFSYILTDKIQKRKIYYYVIDEYTFLPIWSNFLQKRQFKFLEKDMLKIADKVITASSELYDKYRLLHKKVIYFPTPAQLNPYLNYEDNHHLPSDLIDIPKPIILFMGALYDWRIDFSLLIKCMLTYPSISFVFTGSMKINDTILLKELTSLKNFYYLGLKEFQDLPKYLALSNVCIIPYKTNSYGQYAYPVKINEYLSMGKPIVTTTLPSLKYLHDKRLIYWAKTEAEFIKLIKIALNEKKDRDIIKKRIIEAKRNNWEKRIKEFLSIIQDE